jgi:hypothetical protein
MSEFHLVCQVTVTSRGCLPTLESYVYALNSQLWGELRLVVLRKGLQPVTLSLCGFPTRLLFPIIAFAFLVHWYIV